MKKSVLVNEVLFPENASDNIAISITDNCEIRPIKMKPVNFENAFPRGIGEGSRIMIREDKQGNIILVSQERWIPVVNDVTEDTELTEYSSKHEYI